MKETRSLIQWQSKSDWRNIALLGFIGLLVASLFLPAIDQVSARVACVIVAGQQSYAPSSETSNPGELAGIDCYTPTVSTLAQLGSTSVEDSAYKIVIGLLASTLLLGFIWSFFQRRYPGAAS